LETEFPQDSLKINEKTALNTEFTTFDTI